jgi:hypothetical protein
MVKDSETRFWAKVKRGRDCWRWIGGKNGRGYGVFWESGKLVLAHRWAYEHKVGPIPEGLTLDHLCRNRDCVRPEHLEPVTFAENVARGERATKTHCHRGHPFDKINTYYRKDGNGRECRACHRLTQQRLRET